MRLVTTGAIATVGLVGALVFWALSGQSAGVEIPYRDAARVAEGAPLYAGNCAGCHGAEREGASDWRTSDESGMMPAPPHDASGHTWHHTDMLLFAITKYGSTKVVGGGYQSAMAGFEDVLSDREILSILAFIKASWPADVIATHNRINRQAR